MKASELRIRNIVCPDDIMIVTVIRENGMIDLESLTYPEDDYCTKGIEEIDAIPITEEWLLKLGFEKTSIDNIKFVKGLYAIHENYFQSKMTGYNLCIKGVDWYNVASVNHVHQLQNLYFALTGEELQCE